MNNVTFSIIVPCYNVEKYIEKCVESLLQQTIGLPSLEIILIDDASVDQTAERIRQYKEAYPDTIKAVFIDKNKKQGGARNEGLKIAKGTYISFVDADDWVALNMYELLNEYVKSSSPQIIQFSHYDVYAEQMNYISGCVIPGEVQIEDIAMRKLFLMANVLTCGSQMKVYKRDFLEKTGVLFPENVIYEEPYFVYPQFLYLDSFVSLKEPLYYCRIHKDSTMQITKQQIENLLYHPIVQKLLFESLRQRKDVFLQYYNEIEFYFLLTYYIETLYFSGNENKKIAYDFFCEMQQNVKMLCPRWKDNPYYAMQENQVFYEILLTSEQKILKDKLNELCESTVDKLKKWEFVNG